MATKYGHLRGTIPEVPTERDQAFTAALDEVCHVARGGEEPSPVARKDKTLWELTAEFNLLDVEIAEKARAVKALELKRDACELLIRRKIEADSADNVTMNGYTWTPKADPYPAGVEDQGKLVDYFLNNGMKDLLSVHASRLASIVKEEALANELVVEVKKVPDPATGQETEVREYRSGRLPGVKVYLKPALGRVKSSKGAK